MEFETYDDVIDAYNADNMGYSTLTEYIKDQNITVGDKALDALTTEPNNVVTETKTSSTAFPEALVKWCAGHQFDNTTGV